MGITLASIHVHGASTSQVADALAKVIRRRATVFAPAGDWVAVWDEMSEHLVVENERVARELSALLPHPLIALRVSKDKVIYFIYEAGVCLDRYDSCPDYWNEPGDELSDAERAAVVGHPEVLARFARPRTELRQILNVLRGTFELGEMESERQRGAHLADLLGIRRGRVDPRWEHDESNDTEDFVTVENPVGVLSQKLFEAIKACDVDGTVSLLDQGASLEETDEWDCTPLQRAVETEHPFYDYVSPERLQIVRLLLGRGVSRAAIQGVLPHVVMRQALRLVDPLLEAGADVNQVDERGRTALIAAITWPHPSPDVIRLLLRAGADPSTRIDRPTPIDTRRGMTPLHVAAMRNIDVLRLMLDAGADPHVRDSHGETPLIVAATRGSVAAVALLLSAGSVDDARWPDGRSVLPVLIKKREQSRQDPELERVIGVLQDADAGSRSDQ